MRSQLLVGGLMVALMGGSFYFLEIPLVYFWSVPFVIGGALMALASPFIKEREGLVQAPEGYKFCVFCTEPMIVSDGKCQRCGGTQPRGEG